jgi:tetratricopeptide (TPR) repeat protein
VILRKTKCVLSCIVLLNLWLGTQVMAQPVVTREPAPQSVDDLRRQVATLKALVYDPDARFSASVILAQLRDLATFASKRTDSTADLRDTHLMIGNIEKKVGSDLTARDAYQRGLSIDASPPLPPHRAAVDHWHLAELLADAKDYAASAKHYRHAMQHAAGVSTITEDQRLGIRQQLGFVLHESNRFSEALEINLALLPEGEALHGKDSDLLRGLITNIAQNLHALGRKDEADPYLARAIALAQAAGKVWNEQKLLFQRGVLAFERDRHDDARRFMRERIALVTQHNRKDLIASAREDLAILEDKIRRGVKQ